MSFYVKKLFRENGQNPELVPSLTNHIIIGMLVGARLAHCLFYEPDLYLANPIEIVKFWEGGLASHGGYFGVFVAVFVFLLRNPDLKFLWIMDLIVGPCLFVGGLIRVGNFFNSEIVGHPTNSSFGIIFSHVDQIPRHPAQLYEAVGYFTIAGILMMTAKYKFKTWPQGANFALALVLSFTFRFFVEYFKAEQSHIILTESINMGQILSLVFVLGGVVLFLFVRKQK